MKKYEVTLTAHYEKTVSVYADSPEEAREKLKTVLFDTDLVKFPLRLTYPHFGVSRTNRNAPIISSQMQGGLWKQGFVFMPR